MKDDMLYHTQINTCMPEEQFDKKKNPQNYEKVLIKMKEQKKTP